MAHANPPFRADQVGSLLRPLELQRARAAARAGTIGHAALREVEDRCIQDAVAKQEAVLSLIHISEPTRH